MADYLEAADPSSKRPSLVVFSSALETILNDAEERMVYVCEALCGFKALLERAGALNGLSGEDLAALLEAPKNEAQAIVSEIGNARNLCSQARPRDKFAANSG